MHAGEIENIEIFPLNVIFFLKSKKRVMLRFGTTYYDQNEIILDEIIAFADSNNITFEVISRENINQDPVPDSMIPLYKVAGNKLECLLCPHYCKLARGKTGICGVRKNTGEKIESSHIRSNFRIFT